MNLTKWVNEGGKGDYEKSFATDQSKKAIELAQEYLKGHVGSPLNFKDIRDSVIPQVIFLDELRDNYAQVSMDMMYQLDRDYNFSE